MSSSADEATSLLMKWRAEQVRLKVWLTSKFGVGIRAFGVIQPDCDLETEIVLTGDSELLLEFRLGFIGRPELYDAAGRCVKASARDELVLVLCET